METIHFLYIFRVPDDRQEIFDLNLDSHSLDIIGNILEELPPWTRLDCHQCPNCKLTIQTHTNCPVATHLVKIVSFCTNVFSYDEVLVDIVTPERVVYKGTTAQKGISSLMGLVMATSGCPHMSFLKPMARFHLPFASAEETVYRATSMYLLAQYFLQKHGKEVDLELKGLADIYQNIQVINKAMAERLRAISDKDSAMNALVLLDIFAKTLPFAIEESLEDVRYLFTPYLRQSDNNQQKEYTG
jgi:hypothetical protein